MTRWSLVIGADLSEFLSILENPNKDLDNGGGSQLRRKRRDLSEREVLLETDHGRSRVRREAALPESASSTGNEQINCRTGSCKAFKCSINRINSGKSSVIYIRTNLWSANFAKLSLGASNFVTNLKLTFNGPTADQNQQAAKCSMSDQVIVTIQPGESEDKTKVEWWIILLAVLGAAILLAVMIAVMYKFGFFERKRKIKNITSPAEEAQPKQHEAFEEDDEE